MGIHWSCNIILRKIILEYAHNWSEVCNFLFFLENCMDAFQYTYKIWKVYINDFESFWLSLHKVSVEKFCIEKVLNRESFWLSLHKVRVEKFCIEKVLNRNWKILRHLVRKISVFCLLNLINDVVKLLYCQGRAGLACALI